MSDRFFEAPILNSPYEYPGEHWELDEARQPVRQRLPSRRPTGFLLPILKPSKWWLPQMCPLDGEVAR